MMQTFQIYDKETSESYETEILSVFSEFTYKSNYSVRWDGRVEKNPHNKQTQKNSW